MNYRQRKDAEKENKRKLVELFGEIPDTSGIYILTRVEDGFKYAYIGQAKHLLTRLEEHLRGFQHIDNSIRNHGLYSAENPTGWKLESCLTYSEEELDEQEQYFILTYANAGYQMRNKTAGGQGKGKFGIGETKPSRGYYDGLKQGYTKAQKEVSKYFEKNLTYAINGKPNKNKEKALKKFENFIKNT